MIPALALFLLVVLLLALGRARRLARHDAALDAAVRTRLAATAEADPPRFEPTTVDRLPEPARRFLRFAIAPGTPLAAAMEIEMEGEIGLGTKAWPGYRPMRACQILAPSGFVWEVEAGHGLSRVAGSDGFEGGHSWTRFRLFGTIPVVRAGGNADHARSAFGRLVAESVFWNPAALLPGDGVGWEAPEGNVARATVRRSGMVQSVDVTIAEDGRPMEVVLQRWTNANPGKVWRLQPFGGTLADFRRFGGFTLPSRVDGGNLFGTADYFPFFRARVLDIRPAGTAQAEAAR